MQKRTTWVLLAAAGVLVAASAYANRATLRDAWFSASKPTLPEAVVHTTSAAVSDEPVKPADVPIATPTPPPPSTPTPGHDPLFWNGALPAETNLDIPFLLQAPKQNWSQPFEDGCEEASSIMVDAFYRGRTKDYGPDEGEKVMLDLVAFEDKTYGKNKDTTAAETATFIRAYFGYKTVLVRPVTSADDIRKALALGYPVIVPAYGKALGNPNFRNGGPMYHMLVIKGYLKDHTWITNDPGTRRGPDYVYNENVLMDAIHDWNGGDVPNGDPVMLVVLPNP